MHNGSEYRVSQRTGEPRRKVAVGPEPRRSLHPFGGGRAQGFMGRFMALRQYLELARSAAQATGARAYVHNDVHARTAVRYTYDAHATRSTRTHMICMLTSTATWTCACACACACQTCRRACTAPAGKPAMEAQAAPFFAGPRRGFRVWAAQGQELGSRTERSYRRR